MVRGKQVDKIFLGIVSILLVAGFLIFTSASLGLLARTGASFSSVATNQFVALLIGCCVAFVVSKIRYVIWRKLSFYIFIFSLILTLLVFVPGIGLEHGGGKRWVDFKLFSFQPAEFLKIAFVIYAAALLAAAKEKIATFKGGMMPLIIMLTIVGAILLKQPDTDTFFSIFLATMGMFVVAGGRFRHLLALSLVSLSGFAALVLVRPYLMQRITTFLNPAADPLGAGYQIQQSLIAIGSGEMFGRGFGQSLQKFSYLPEPIGDSIFAVAAEEFGFVGGVILVSLFLFLTLRGFRIAAKSPDSFGGLLVTGIVILIVSGSFMNIASMLGLMPLSGLPLLFVSHGGTAMMFTLFQVGIILNISKFRKS
ncbi:MAG: Stage V sporulation protein E [Parcubacteria group bacterium GW2011_GWA2_47_16]|nr:MAG: Stage V sporulation protein E [Parcubacteria group bacterium GW2011_GWA2_47_16]